MLSIFHECSSVGGCSGSMLKTVSFHLSCFLLMNQRFQEMALLPSTVHTWSVENSHAVTLRSHQVRFAGRVWAGIIGDYLTGSYLLPQRPISETYRRSQDTLPLLLEDVSIRIRQPMWFQHDGAPAHFARIVNEYLNDV